MQMRTLMLVIAAILVGSISFGCRKTAGNSNQTQSARLTHPAPSNKGIQNPGDPALTYEVVEKNPAAY